MALKKCKECGNEISTKAEACPKCGAKNPKTSIVAKGCLGLIIFVMGMAVLGGLVGKKSSDSVPSVGTAAPQAPAARASSPSEQTSPPAPKVRWLTDSCTDMAENFGMQSKMTDLQKKATWEENHIEGTHFKWDLQVQSVDTTFGKIQAQFKCRDSSAFASDVILSIDDQATALKLVKGQFYKIHGTLRDYGNIIGLSGKLVAIE